IGVVYAPDGLRRFVAAMGPGATRRLFLTGTPVDADEALSLGLVDQVVDGDALWGTAMESARAVAAAAPLAVEGTRAIVDAITDRAPWELVEETADSVRRRAFASKDLAEGLAAARERRLPEFTGT
ncbi:MAG: enoyl-CoA hydratase-related protein, partial [Thermoleophilia bacterium]